jgi:hypothetical protein
MALELAPPPLYLPFQLCRLHGLERNLGKFILASRPPEDLRCLFLASQNLVTLFQSLPAYWQTIDPFEKWTEVFELFLASKYEIRRLAGPQVEAGITRRSKRSKSADQPMWSRIGEAPLFAILTLAHENESPVMRAKYGALQLQVIYAHWRKIRRFLEDHPGHVGDIKEGKRRAEWEQRDIKMAESAARAVRSFQVKDLEFWLESLDTFCHPDNFSRELAQNVPRNGDARSLHYRIAYYCDERYQPGSGGVGGERMRSVRRYLYMVDYTGCRFGLDTQPPADEENGNTKSLEHIVRSRAKNKAGKTLSWKKIVQLGLDPLELADGNPAILAGVPKGATRQEAIEGTRAQTRGFEIDRRLFPWNS